MMYSIDQIGRLATGAAGILGRSFSILRLALTIIFYI